MNLKERILKVIEEHGPIDATTILSIIEAEGVEIPKWNELYDVNEFFELEEDQLIFYEKGWNDKTGGWRLVE